MLMKFWRNFHVICEYEVVTYINGGWGASEGKVASILSMLVFWAVSQP
jgi:hypothetical protein